MKLYIVKGILIDEKLSSTTSKRITSFIGYYTNLKEVYSQFDRKSIKSYSTVANNIKESNQCYIRNSKFSIDKKLIRFQQIKIELIQVNKIYSSSKYVNINQLISQELSDFKF